MIQITLGISIHSSKGNEAEDLVASQGAGDSLEGLLVEKALQDMMTLPQAVTEVASKTKGQSEELSKQRQLLKQLQVELLIHNFFYKISVFSILLGYSILGTTLYDNMLSLFRK